MWRAVTPNDNQTTSDHIKFLIELAEVCEEIGQPLAYSEEIERCKKGEHVNITPRRIDDYLKNQELIVIEASVRASVPEITADFISRWEARLVTDINLEMKQQNRDSIGSSSPRSQVFHDRDEIIKKITASYTWPKFRDPGHIENILLARAQKGLSKELIREHFLSLLPPVDS